MKRLIATSLAAASIALTPLAAGATQQTPSANGPIHLNEIQIAPNMGVFNNFAFPGLLTVSFTNTNTVAATDIVFALRGYDGQLIRHYKDVGTYSQGLSIRHTFTDLAPDYEQSLEVEEATFADGTTWTNPTPFQSRRQSR